MSWRWILPFLFWIAQTAYAQEPWGYLFEFRTLEIHPLTGESVNLGRLPQSQIVLSDSRVSRRHAEIREGTNGIVVVDLGTTNGTRLNRRELPSGQTAPLLPGDVLELAAERFLYHESEPELWEDVLRHMMLGNIVRLRVDVHQDRAVKSLGVERIVPAESFALVEPEIGRVRMHYPEDTGRRAGFASDEAAFVGNVLLSDGLCRLSLWGLARGDKMVSRRASFSYLKHGELLVGLGGESRLEARNRFRDGWSNGGIHFLLPLLELVVERPPEAPGVRQTSLNLLGSLIEQDGSTAIGDAACSLAFLHRLDPANAAVPLLAARAEAKRIEVMARKRRGLQADTELAELNEALAAGKDWLRKAVDLGADALEIKKAETEIAEAARLIGESP